MALAKRQSKRIPREPNDTPVELLVRRTAYYEKRRFPPMITLKPRRVKRAKRAKEREDADEHSFSLVLLAVVIVVGLLFAWMGIGALMKRGLLPYIDIGYTWLNELIAQIRA